MENRTGAGGTIGMDLAMKSPPDGYTVLITNDNAASAPHIMSLPYDYTKELVPVIYLARQPQILARAPLARRELGHGACRLRQGQSGARLRDLGRRLEPARHRRMVQARGRAQARPRALSRRRPGDQRSDRGPREDRLARTDGARAALQGRQRCACSRNPPPSARRCCRTSRRSRRRASRAWCSKPGMRAFVPKGTPPAIVARLNAEMNEGADRPQPCRRASPRARWSRSAARRRSSASSREPIRRNTRGW